MSEITPLMIIEAALFAATSPMSLDALGKLFGEPKLKSSEVKKILNTLNETYAGRAVRLTEVASGYRFEVLPELVPYISGAQEEKPAKFSRALLETLALIAYRQPITRGEIEEIRGVVVSTNIVKTLDELGWVRIVGYKDVPGKPALYATSKGFLDYFGLKSLEELPPLAALKELDVLEQMVDEANMPTDETDTEIEDTEIETTAIDNDALHINPPMVSESLDDSLEMPVIESAIASDPILDDSPDLAFSEDELEFLETMESDT